MISPDKIIRTNRRSLSLTVSKRGELIVRAPKKMPSNRIYNFIFLKEKWIKNKQDEMNNKYQKNFDILNYKKFIFLGKLYNIESTNAIKNIEIIDDKFLIPSNLNYDETIKIMYNWYIKTAKELIKKRLDYFSNIMQLNYTNFSLSNSKNRWGTCDRDGNLKFNFRVIMLPHKVVDYIIIHELTHLVCFDHSKNFYKMIESIMGEYKVQQKLLKEYAYVLEIFR